VCTVSPFSGGVRLTGNMKPKLLCDVLRQESPRKFYNNPNRYTVLRDVSPADSVRSTLSNRSRPIAVKRKLNQVENPSQSSQSYSSVVSNSSQQVAPLAESESLNVKIVTVRSLCEKVTTDLSAEGLDPRLVAIMSTLNQAVTGIVDIQQTLVGQPPTPQVIVSDDSGSGSQASPSAPESAATKRARKGSNDPVFVDLGTYRQQGKSSQNAPSRYAYRTQDPEPDPIVTKFKETVKEAEKSTLLLNLNLGKVPTINQDTISRKVTMALTEMAATAEKRNGKIPSDETAASLDDVLSVVKGMKFFGKSTKSYRNRSDPNSGSYCTVPVRYDFHDKDARIYAETFLRDKCKVQCVTPYPTILRECIRQIIDQVKQDFPNSFVRVTVDTNNMCFRILRRPLVDKNYKGKKEWFKCDDTIPIPEAALHVYARSVPDGFKLEGIPIKGRKNSGNNSVSMDDIPDTTPGVGENIQSIE
jgi:hypothetical protein